MNIEFEKMERQLRRRQRIKIAMPDFCGAV